VHARVLDEFTCAVMEECCENGAAWEEERMKRAPRPIAASIASFEQKW